MDNVVGTENSVTIHRKIQIMFDFVANVGNKIVLCSGSRGEGLNFSSSDQDYMIVDNNTGVINDPDTSIEDQKTVLLMRYANSVTTKCVLLENDKIYRRKSRKTEIKKTNVAQTVNLETE